jgi:hypothetical protein
VSVFVGESAAIVVADIKVGLCDPAAVAPSRPGAEGVDAIWCRADVADPDSSSPTIERQERTNG